MIVRAHFLWICVSVLGSPALTYASGPLSAPACTAVAKNGPQQNSASTIYSDALQQCKNEFTTEVSIDRSKISWNASTQILVINAEGNEYTLNTKTNHVDYHFVPRPGMRGALAIAHSYDCTTDKSKCEGLLIDAKSQLADQEQNLPNGKGGLFGIGSGPNLDLPANHQKLKCGGSLLDAFIVQYK